MKLVTARTLDSIRRCWTGWTEPAPNITDPDERLRARFISSLLLFNVLLIPTLLVIYYVISRASDLPARIGVSALGGVFIFGMYWYSRRTRPERIARGGILGGTAILYLGVIALGGSTGTHSLYYLMILVLFASLFLGLRFNILLMAANVVVMLTLPVINPTITYGLLIDGPLRFVAMLSVVTIAAAGYRIRLEEARRRELAENAARLRLVSELIPNYAFSFKLGVDGRWINEWVSSDYVTITGYAWDDMERHGVDSLFLPEDYDRMQADTRQIEAGHVSKGEYRIRTRAGQVRWLRIVRHPVWDAAQKQVIRYFGVAEDITDLHRAQDSRLQIRLQQERLKLIDDLMQAVSHDFRTSLTSIENSRYLISRQLNGTVPPELRQRLDLIQKSVRHMSDQLEDLHTITHLSDLKRLPVQFNSLVQDIAADFAAQARKHDQMIVLQLNRYLPTVSADQYELRRGISELMQNALAFTPAAGKVTLRTFPATHGVCLEVQDSGQGIPEEQQSRIFEPFYRGDAARAVETGGIGLGLSIARLVAEAHGGTLTVSSALGQGTTFRLTLPTEPPPNP
jgi:PAS domain S-box-containing protein